MTMEPSPSLPTPVTPPVDAKSDGSPNRLFIAVLIAFVVLLTASWVIAYALLRNGPQASDTATDIRPPVSFQTALLVHRIDELGYELRRFPQQGTDVNAAEWELHVLRARAETLGTEKDLQRVTDALNTWETKYLSPR